MTNNLELGVHEEIEALHKFFVNWFSGKLPVDDFETGFLSRFDADFLIVPPAGSLLTLAQLASAIKQNHANNPDFRIAIRNVKVRRTLGNHILATYEEWQRNAKSSTPPDNARIATVLFKNSEPLKWLHIHETWMPKAVMSADSFNF